MNRLQASEFDFVEFRELARFLSIGIKRYVATISKHQQQCPSQLMLNDIHLQERALELGSVKKIP